MSGNHLEQPYREKGQQTPNTVKVDITVSEILLFPAEQLPVLRTYP
ncbi:MAG: hypothetical protein ABR923_14145 [Terracidiphilus sp.]|jgi:hypothetical protein